jgi:hypothetical protein
MSKLGMSIGMVAAVFAGKAMAQTTLSPLTSFGSNGWLAPGSASYLTTDNTQRGMAYNPANNHLYLVNRAGGLSVQVLDGTTGASTGKTLDVSGISGGTIALSAITVAGDGAIYAANLVLNNDNGGNVRIYRWANENATPTLAYNGVPAAGVRFGDNLSSRGAGANTQLLLGGGGFGSSDGNVYNSFAVLTTANGTDFSGGALSITGPDSAAFQLGIAFGPGDTVYGRRVQFIADNLEYASFDLASQSATRVTGGRLTLAATGDAILGVDAANALMVTGDYTTNEVRLYGLADPANPLLLDTQNLTTSHNTNGNITGAVAFGNGRLYVLNTNNGIQAFNVAVPEPASVGLLGLSALGLLARRRR